MDLCIGSDRVHVKLLHARAPSYLLPGSQITKHKRHMILDVRTVSGLDSMKCEQYQRRAIEEGTRVPCLKSNHIRINTELNTIERNPNPYSKPRGFDWTEDFDGIQMFNGYTFYINLKSIVEGGGSQTRSLKLVYDFIKGQKNLYPDYKTFFVNILDGEFCSRNMHQFDHLVSDHIYIGDLKGYFPWINSKLETIL